RSLGLWPTYTQFPLAASDLVVTCNDWRPWRSLYPTSLTFSAPSDRGSAGACRAATGPLGGEHAARAIRNGPTHSAGTRAHDDVVPLECCLVIMAFPSSAITVRRSLSRQYA